MRADDSGHDERVPATQPDRTTWRMLPWKATHVLTMVKRHRLSPATVCEIGCGAGQVLVELQARMAPTVRFHGYDVSAAAIDLCRDKANQRLAFTCGDVATICAPGSGTPALPRRHRARARLPARFSGPSCRSRLQALPHSSRTEPLQVPGAGPPAARYRPLRPRPLLHAHVGPPCPRRGRAPGRRRLLHGSWRGVREDAGIADRGHPRDPRLPRQPGALGPALRGAFADWS